MKMSEPEVEALVRKLILGVMAAGEAIMEIYDSDFQVKYKMDSSPLTEADQEANRILMDCLAESTPHIPVISEEGQEISYAERKDWESLWLVDPLDGTKEFVKRNGEFTVNMALIESGTPRLGIVFQPTTKTIYYGGPGFGAFKIGADGEVVELEATPHYKTLELVRIVASRSHPSKEVMEFIETLEEANQKTELLSIGSSLKFCLLADGKADVYPRVGPTMEWDTAAAHAVLLGVGKNVYRYGEKTPLVYNKENLKNPSFIAE